MNLKKPWISALVGIALSMYPLLSHAVTVPNWQSPPAACLPERAKKWDTSKAESLQTACHCPPTTQCASTAGVKTMADYFAKSTMPGGLAVQCCSPTCPSGTDKAGQPIPSSGSCDDPVTPPPTDGGKTPQEQCEARNSDALKQRCLVTGTDDEGTTFQYWLDGPQCNHWYWIQYERGSNGYCEYYFWTPPGSCLSADSKVTKANGKSATLQDIKIGDVLKGPHGIVVVKATNHYNDQTSHFYTINDFKFAITGNHPLKTTTGWKVVEPEAGNTTYGKLALGDVLETQSGPVTIKTIAADAHRNGKMTVNLGTIEDRPFYVDGVAVKPFQAVNFTYPVQGE